MLLLGGMTREDVLWIVAEVYETERSLDWWAEQGKTLAGGRHLRGVWCDPSEPGNIVYFYRAGLPTVKANNEVIPGITLVASRIGMGRTRWRRSAATISGR